MSLIVGKRFFLLLILFYLNLSMSIGYADINNNVYHIRDAGATPCKTIKNIFRQNSVSNRNYILQWTGGFLSASSFFNQVIDTYPIVDTESIIEMSMLVCDEYPEEDNVLYQSILIICLDRLRPYWVRSSPDITVLNNSGKSVKIYNESIISLQRDIVKLGAKIKLDGVFGNETGDIISRFHKSLGLDLIPLPNGITLYFLTKPK